MKLASLNATIFFILLTLFLIGGNPTNTYAQADRLHYLDDIKAELATEWPKNRTINLVFHGHSVPSGYFKTPVVNTFGAYPHLILKSLKEKYPYAVINVIVTAIGGENSFNGQKRFARDVLPHNPDVLFIDYALNDRVGGMEQSTEAMSKMIEAALAKKIKVILLTPTPHQNFNILDPDDAYKAYKDQVTNLAKKYHVGLVDSYSLFKEKIAAGHSVTEYMSQVNHPNEAGHQLVADEAVKWF